MNAQGIIPTIKQLKERFRAESLIGKKEYFKCWRWIEHIQRYIGNQFEAIPILIFIIALSKHRFLIYPFTENPEQCKKFQDESSMMKLSKRIMSAPGYASKFTDENLLKSSDAPIVGGKKYLEMQALAAKNQNVGKRVGRKTNAKKVTLTNMLKQVIPGDEKHKTMNITHKTEVTIERHEPLEELQHIPNLIPINPQQAGKEDIVKVRKAIIDDLTEIYLDDPAMKNYIATWVDRLQTFTVDIMNRLELMMMLHAMLKKRILIEPFVISFNHLKVLNKVRFKELVPSHERSFLDRMNEAYERAMLFKEVIAVDPDDSDLNFEYGVSDQLNLLLIKKFKIMPEIHNVIQLLEDALGETLETQMHEGWYHYLKSGIGNGYTVQEKLYLLLEVLCFVKTNKFIPSKLSTEIEDDPRSFETLKAFEINKILREMVRDLRKGLGKSNVEYPEDVRKGPGKLENRNKAPTTIETDTVPALDTEKPCTTINETIAEKEGATAMTDAEIEQLIDEIQLQRQREYELTDIDKASDQDLEDRLDEQESRWNRFNEQIADEQESRWNRFNEQISDDMDQIADESAIFLSNDSLASYFSSDELVDVPMHAYQDPRFDSDNLMQVLSSEEVFYGPTHPLPQIIRKVIQVVANLPSYRFPKEIAALLYDREDEMVERVFISEDPSRKVK